MSAYPVKAIIVGLQNYAEDPMWVHHAEVPKALLRLAVKRIAELEAALARVADEPNIDKARAIADAVLQNRDGAAARAGGDPPVTYVKP